MSGHSKWATIKHKKAATDAKRAKVFAKLIRQVEVAAREGGPDPEANPTLRTFFQKARDNSIPLDTIRQAIKRATGGGEQVAYEQIVYEGYAPGGVAILIEVLTDNRNRSAADVRAALTKNGGSQAEPGAVSWQFDRKGVILVPKAVDEEAVMLAALDAGAEDITDEGEFWQVTTDPSALPDIRQALDDAGIEVENSEVTMLPQNTVPVAEADQAKQVLRLIDILEENDDIQAVYSNADIADEIMEAVAS